MVEVTTGSNDSLEGAIAAEVRAELARHKRTLTSLRRRTGITPTYLSLRMNGHRPFTITDLERIAEELDLPVSALVVRAEATLARSAA